jgi:hypothetical protein
LAIKNMIGSLEQGAASTHIWRCRLEKEKKSAVFVFVGTPRPAMSQSL